MIKKRWKYCVLQLLKRNWQIVAIVIAAMAIWMVVESNFEGRMTGIVDRVIREWKHDWFAGIAIVSIIGWSVCFCVLHRKKTYLPSTEEKLFVLLLCSFYGYYRFISIHFEFWEIGGFTYLDLLFIVPAIYTVYEIIGVWRSCQRMEQQDQQESCLLRDDSLENPLHDILGYANKADELAKLLNMLDLSEHSYSVGIVGEWGIGKSSFLNLFARQQCNSGSIVVRFAPRSAKDVNSISNEFFSVLSQALSMYDGRCSTLISRYAFTLQSINNYKWLYTILNIFFDWTSEPQKAKINNALRTIARRVYVIIEDLDRLTAKEIIEVLKLIDGNGDFSNTIFLTAYDQDYVNGVLKHEIGYEDTKSLFTDKYFQYVFPLKRQSTDALLDFARTYVFEWALSRNSDMSAKTIIQNEWISIWQYLISNLTTIRAWKRYTNLLRADYEQVRECVNFSDYALVTLIRYLDNDAYWALFARHFITYAESYFVTHDRYALIKDYQQKTKKYSHIRELDAMLEYMFSDTAIRPGTVYGRINRTESFENYFHGIKSGKLYYPQLNEMMCVAELKEAIEMMDRCVSSIENEKNQRSIEEFLCSRDALWIETTDRLSRYVCLLAYAYGKYQSHALSQAITRVLTRDMYEKIAEVIEIHSMDDYREIVMSAMRAMLDYFPSEICRFLIRQINQRKGNDKIDEMLVETMEQDAALAETAQQRYDALYGTNQWNPKISLICAQISVLPNTDFTPRASRQIKQMMNEYRDDYAKALIFVESPNYSENYSLVNVWEFDKVWPLLGKIEKFGAWINKVADADVRFILQSLYSEAKQTNNARIKVAYIPQDRWTDYPFIAELIKAARKD